MCLLLVKMLIVFMCAHTLIFLPFLLLFLLTHAGDDYSDVTGV